MEDKCYFCNPTPYGQTINIGQQQFNDGTISTVKLNPFDTSLLTIDTCNIPGKGANTYTVFKRIKFCPMCGGKFE